MILNIILNKKRERNLIECEEHLMIEIQAPSSTHNSSAH